MSPVIIQGLLTIAGNTTIENILVENSQWRRYLRCPFDAVAEFVATTTAPVQGGLVVSLDYGSKNVIHDYTPRIESADQPMQEDKDTINDQFSPNQGQIFTLRAVNQNALANAVRFRLALVPRDGERLPDKRITGSTNILGAGAVDVQLMDGNKYERNTVPVICNFYSTASADGIQVRCEIETQTLAPTTDVTPANRQPQRPFDLTLAGMEVPPDSQILFPASNTSGGAESIQWIAEMQELYRED